MTDIDPAFSTAHDLADSIQAGRLSPVTLMAALLDRISRHDEKLHSFVTVYGKDALQAAEAAEAKRKAEEEVRRKANVR